ncbi:MAG: MAPEG family protein [Proteobacteria bacterium]|nr:MAPEG family protein [Pseudomonadota bacterium]
MTLLGAQLFFWARIAYAVCYLGGIKWVRTLSWLVSIVGILLILWQLL